MGALPPSRKVGPRIAPGCFPGMDGIRLIGAVPAAIRQAEPGPFPLKGTNDASRGPGAAPFATRTTESALKTRNRP